MIRLGAGDNWHLVPAPRGRTARLSRPLKILSGDNLRRNGNHRAICAPYINLSRRLEEEEDDEEKQRW